MSVANLISTYLRLRPDSSIEQLTVDEAFWPSLMTGKLGNFHHEYLVTTAAYGSDWPNWEQHPAGDEIVCLLAGAVTLILELPGGNQEIRLNGMGDFALVPQGTWHTARIHLESKMLFITAGEGTAIRPVLPTLPR